MIVQYNMKFRKKIMQKSSGCYSSVSLFAYVIFSSADHNHSYGACTVKSTNCRINAHEDKENHRCKKDSRYSYFVKTEAGL
jgi:hypothetical protein